MADGPVTVSYHTLRVAPESLLAPIQQAFGPDALGVIVIKGELGCPRHGAGLISLTTTLDLPSEFAELRERLLRLGQAFAALPEERREKYARANVSYL